MFELKTRSSAGRVLHQSLVAKGRGGINQENKIELVKRGGDTLFVGYMPNVVRMAAFLLPLASKVEVARLLLRQLQAR